MSRNIFPGLCFRPGKSLLPAQRQPRGQLPQVTKQVGLLRIGVLFKLRETIFSFPLPQGLVWISETFKLGIRLTAVKEPQGFMFQAFLHLIQRGKKSLIKSQIHQPSKKA